MYLFGINGLTYRGSLVRPKTPQEPPPDNGWVCNMRVTAAELGTFGVFEFFQQ